LNLVSGDITFITIFANHHIVTEVVKQPVTRDMKVTHRSLAHLLLQRGVIYKTTHTMPGAQ